MAATQERSAPRDRRTPAETVEAARRLFETTDMTAQAIGAAVGVAGVTVGRFAKRHGWRRPAAAERRRQLVAGIRRKVDREIARAHRAVGGDEADGAAAERAARTLGSLVRTLRELAKLDAEQARASGPRGEEPDGDFSDLDGFRAALAERLERLRREHES